MTVTERDVPDASPALTRRALRERREPPSRRRTVRAERAAARAEGAGGRGTRAADRPVAAYTDAARRPFARAVHDRLLSAGALLFAGALALGTSLPAAAFITPGLDPGGFTVIVDGQSVAVSADVGAALAARAKYSSASAAEVQAREWATTSGGHTFTPTTGSVRWPFPFSTSISDGFGPRKAPCAGCSTFHKGIDFTPGEGVPTYAIAAGTVQSVIVSNAGLGNEVVIDHVIDGRSITSVYGHLEMNSSPLKAGDTVKVGQMVGKVGSTGTVTGANMHLEVHVEGVAVDPYAWLTKNAR
ncbi:M23 family metallopeptidase [Galbitalea sp. SE-J8]|uniref:M23 family metallopeptidase n=1 Tax=Galbitalea sp. SE-J8 TaxID=3054952 RepID=UPI00259CE3AB|nr:M23 family metallopeptidase [Galbitalea sp. SE-J8]MDM4762431.1 M23 family metallopeptidase [Galbitalea sp. SE-J8]